MAKKTLSKSIETIEIMKAKIISQLEDEIGKIKNPKELKECGSFGIIVPASKLSIESWSPSYYDVRAQSKRLIEYIKNAQNMEIILCVLREIVDTGRTDNIKGIKFNQTFRDGLKKIIN